MKFLVRQLKCLRHKSEVGTIQSLRGIFRYSGRIAFKRERCPEAYWRRLEIHLGRCEDYWQHQPDAAPGAARPNLTQADPVPASQACGRGADRGDDADGPTRDPRVPLDGGTIEEAS